MFCLSDLPYVIFGLGERGFKGIVPPKMKIGRYHLGHLESPHFYPLSAALYTVKYHHWELLHMLPGLFLGTNVCPNDSVEIILANKSYVKNI